MFSIIVVRTEEIGITALFWWVVGDENSCEIFREALDLYGQFEGYGEPRCGCFLCVICKGRVRVQMEGDGANEGLGCKWRVRVQRDGEGANGG